MCETEPGYHWSGWQGWPSIPAAAPGRPLGPWINLSHKVGPNMPNASIFPPPEFRLIKDLPRDPFIVTEVKMAVHSGTHIDAPRHFLRDGPAMHEIPLDRLHGAGVVWRIEVEPECLIDAIDFARAKPALREGDIVALDTGWAARCDSPEYERHPSLTVAAAEWLVERGVKLLACDFPTPDLVYYLRAPGFDWPVHRTLLMNGVLICENLTGHAALAGRRVEFIFAALDIEHCDGAPARVLARPMAA